MILLTVAVPCYQSEATLPHCLESFGGDRFAGRIEVIVVNDGSTDGTRGIALRYADAHPSVFRLIDQENGGHGAAVAAGIRAASGKYFRVVDGDDSVDADALGDLLALIGRTDADWIVDERTDAYDDTGEERRRPLPDNTPTDRDVPFRDVPLELIPYLTIHAISAKASMLADPPVELLGHTYYEDFEFVLKSAARARSVRFLRSGVYRYRLGNPAQSVHRDGFVARYGDHDRVLRESLRFMESGDCPPERRGYAERAVDLLIRTQLKIALVYDRDRARGRSRARALMRELKIRHPEFYEKARFRYRAATALSALRVGERGIARLARAVGKG